MKKESHRSNWILYLAGVLLCLTLFSMHLTSGLYARYAASASGGDSARVAKFDIAQKGTLSELLLLDVYPGFSAAYDIQLNNHSEVAVSYTVSVEQLTNNLPLELTWDGMVMSDNAAASSGTFEANTQDMEKYTLNVSWPKGVNDDAYSYELDALRVVVRVAQVD